MKIELTIIKISIIAACLIIGAGVLQRLVEDKGAPKTQPKSTTLNVNLQNQAAAPSPATPAGVDNTQKPKPKGKVVAIGDSYTYGYPYGIENSWVKLAAQGLGREFINKGKTSQTSADLLARFNGDVLDLEPETVVILVGTGDALRGVSLETYQKNIQEMVKLARSKNITPVLGLPLYLPDPNIKKLITAYRGWLTTYAQGENIKLIDFNPQLVDEKGDLRKGYTDDGKYPNKEGYALMAQVVDKVFRSNSAE